MIVQSRLLSFRNRDQSFDWNTLPLPRSSRRKDRQSSVLSREEGKNPFIIFIRLAYSVALIR